MMPDYDTLSPDWFRRCGRSGLMLPAVSLGCWHNFGEAGSASHGVTDELEFHDRCRELLWTAFDQGITHFDFANNYGPPPGAAEERCGKILRAFPREELVISSKAGYDMWKGPYGNWGSRKYLVTSCDHSLKRLGGDYLDLFYHHRPDPETPLEETMGALDFIVRSGRALYAAVSNYPASLMREALRVCEQNGFVKPILHQPRYNMLDRDRVEPDLYEAAEEEGFGMICFSPLEQGVLTNKYLDGIPGDSRAANDKSPFLTEERLANSRLDVVKELNALAQDRGQSLAQLAIQWTLRKPQMTSALIGASRPEQIIELSKVLESGPLSEEELAKIESLLGG